MEFFFYDSNLGIYSKAQVSSELMKKFEDAKQQGFYMAKGKYPTGKYLVMLEKHEIEHLLDKVGNLLCESGVTNGEINSLGRQLDDMIDDLNPYLY